MCEPFFCFGLASTNASMLSPIVMYDLSAFALRCDAENWKNVVDLSNITNIALLGFEDSKCKSVQHGLYARHPRNAPNFGVVEQLCQHVLTGNVQYS